MKRTVALFLISVLVLSTAGCQSNKTNVAEGAVIGGVLGAAAGGIIGHQSGHGGEGAGIGLAAGVLTGALIGSQMKKPGSTAQGAQPAAGQGSQAPSPNQMSLQQIVDLTKQGVNEAVIVDKIRLTNSKFTLSASDLEYLKKNNVSQKVIDVMQGG